MPVRTEKINDRENVQSYTVANEILTQHETAENNAHAHESQNKSQYHVKLEPRTDGN